MTALEQIILQVEEFVLLKNTKYKDFTLQDLVNSVQEKYVVFKREDLKQLKTEIEWNKVEDKLPLPNKPVVIARDSGYNDPRIEIITATYDSKDEDWKDVQGYRLKDSGFKPIVWTDKIRYNKE